MPYNEQRQRTKALLATLFLLLFSVENRSADQVYVLWRRRRHLDQFKKKTAILRDAVAVNAA